MSEEGSQEQGSQGNKAMWGGRFASGTDALLQRFSESVSYDQRLYAHDIRGSIAHARMLMSIGVLNEEELSEIESNLLKIREQIESGQFDWKLELEDVHMNIESRLTEMTSAGAKLHTGRSRNDQVATDMRLWLKETIAENLDALSQLQSALVILAEKNADVLVPGYTHLQRGQPVVFAHVLLAYVEMFSRDSGRFQDAFKRTDVLPLGSGALAGSTLPLDREKVREELGFAEISQNSLDAVSDRDFIVEYLSACSLLAAHLSRLSEDLVLWSSAEFGFVRIGDSFTTGSSLMPQKKNPDVAELVRGKSGRVIGNLVSLLVTLKGLPMTYNRDLQEDKERLFDSADTVQASLEIMAAMLLDTEVKREPCETAASDPLLLATDVADALVRKGVPFRHAHEIVGSAVREAELCNCSLADLPLEAWKKIHDAVDNEILSVFDPRSALGHRPMIGAPNPELVADQIAKWKDQLGLT